jgi:hypothetical protein
MAILEQILLPSLVILFFVLGIAAAAVGVGLIACSTKMFDVFAMVNRAISTRRAAKPLSVPRDIEPVVRQYRKWFAAAIIAGAAWSLYSLLTHFNAAAVTAAVVSGTGTSHFVARWLIEALGWAMGACSLLALAAGILLAFFPRALSAVEQRANRWYSPRRATAGAETMHLPLDRWVEHHPRTAGLAVTAGALIVVASSGLMLFNQPGYFTGG